MAKTKIKTVFRCQECGHTSAKWLGRCPDCDAWNTIIEEKETSLASTLNIRNLTDFSSEVSKLDEISVENYDRHKTGISEFDRILGGGVVPGSVVLLGGAPGIGKSTLMLQVSAVLASKSLKTLYVSGEESLSQVKSRADRLKIQSDNLYIVSETNLENILEDINKTDPKIVIIDSIQTTYRVDVSSAPGSVSQVRECAAEFLRLAKSKAITIFLLGHVTKEGSIAGPRVLEHIVDTVLYFDTEKQEVYRILRAYKNRFGPTSEIGVFEMRGDGLAEVTNPSLMFLNERSSDSPGNVVVSTIEGTRPILLEVQSLVTRTNFGLPRRMVTGYDLNRIIIIVAVLEKRVGLHLESQDVFVNVVGGVKIKETGVDLGILCSIASAHSNFVCSKDTIILGEVGLSGEVRSIYSLSERLLEAEKLGLKKAIVPKSNIKGLKYKGKLNIIGVENVKEAIEQIK